MSDTLIALVNIFVSALTPIGELRLAIPLGLTQYDLPLLVVLVTAIIGNMIPPILILYAAPPIVTWLRKHNKLAETFFDWLFTRTRHKTEKQIKKYGSLALILFVAIPFPTTGAWTGALAAWLFGINRPVAVKYIFFGVLIAGVIVTLLTLGIQISL